MTKTKEQVLAWLRYGITIYGEDCELEGKELAVEYCQSAIELIESI